MTTDQTPSLISAERGKYLLEKWFPVLCSDSEYRERYGVDRPHMSTSIMSTSIILESQEQWMDNKAISNASVAQ